MLASRSQGVGLVARRALRNPVAQNALALYFTQLAEYVLPLVTIPYLVRVLSPAGFGIVAFAQSVMSYVSVFVEYGFGLSATRKVSIHRADRMTISQVAANVWTANSLLAAVALGFLLLAVAIVPQIREVKHLLLLLFGATLGNVLFPVWLFQGMEKMMFVSLLKLSLRLAVTIGTFTMVRRPEDYLLYVALISLTTMVTGAVAAIIGVIRFGLYPVMPSRDGVMKALGKGCSLFLSTALVSLYTRGSVLVLGLFADHATVGYYSAAERLVRAVARLTGPVSEAAYARVSHLSVESTGRVLYWARRMLWIMGSVGFVLSVAVFAGADRIASLALGVRYDPLVRLIQIMAPLVMLTSVTNVLSMQIMLPLGMDETFAKVLLGTGLLGIVLAVLLASAWGAWGVAVASLVTEVFAASAMFVALVWHGLRP